MAVDFLCFRSVCREKEFRLNTNFLLTQFDYSLSISVCDRYLELVIKLFNNFSTKLNAAKGKSMYGVQVSFITYQNKAFR